MSQPRARDEKDALRLLKVCSDEKKLTEAYTDLAKCYLHGTGAKKDREEAIKYLNLAADNGCTRGMYFLGRTLLDKGKKKSKTEMEEAASMLRTAADQKHVEAAAFYGSMLSLGESGWTKIDKVEGERYLRQAAVADDDCALTSLGIIFLSEDRTKREKKEGLEYIRKAAELKNEIAQMILKAHALQRPLAMKLMLSAVRKDIMR